MPIVTLESMDSWQNMFCPQINYSSVNEIWFQQDDTTLNLLVLKIKKGNRMDILETNISRVIAATRPELLAKLVETSRLHFIRASSYTWSHKVLYFFGMDNI